MHRLRLRRPADLDTIISWVPDAEALHRFAGPRLSWPLTPDQVIEGTGNGNVTAWVSTDSSELVGHFELTITGTSVRLGRVLIDPARRGLGLGRQLVASAIEKVQAMGALEIRLNVVADNTVARRVYLGLGFTVSSEQDRADTLAMTLALQRSSIKTEGGSPSTGLLRVPAYRGRACCRSHPVGGSACGTVLSRRRGRRAGINF